ncbi:MAG TPA: hypothetical protein VL243_16800 [Vicinamibacterales bacterium]|jgi:hypothetical protein|nr:hypothetical protein [Vicinamibacterales bacterium]
MANRSRPSQQKRHKERARQEKQKMKAERRLEAKSRGGRTDGLNPGEDPDIAGIIPGPQPLREDQIGLEPDVDAEAETTE